jgi:hypothetical protein
MGESVGTIFDALLYEVYWVHDKWNEYVTLFATNDKRIELMNESAPAFFRTVQDTLWEAVLLHICRITDPAKSAGKKNLTLKRLENNLERSPIAHPVRELVTLASDSSDFARDWRNRTLAHKDLELSLKKDVKPLAEASRIAINKSLESIYAVINLVSTHYLDTEYDFSSDDGDAVSVLYLIRDGIEFEKDRITRLKTGKFKQSDQKHETI